MKPPHKKMQSHFRENAAGLKNRIPCPSQIRPQPLRTMCFIIFRTSAPQEKRRMILDIFHLQPAMKLTQLLSDMFVNDSRFFLLSGHVSATNRYTDTELVAELLHQRDRSVSQHLFRATSSHFTVFAFLAVIDTVYPATSPICSPNILLPDPVLSCLRNRRRVQNFQADQLPSHTQFQNDSASDKSHTYCKYSPELKKKSSCRPKRCAKASFVFQFLKALSLHPPFPKYAREGPAHGLIEQFRRVPSA